VFAGAVKDSDVLLVSICKDETPVGKQNDVPNAAELIRLGAELLTYFENGHRGGQAPRGRVRPNRCFAKYNSQRRDVRWFTAGTDILT
jgi:hypothetical protein